MDHVRVDALLRAERAGDHVAVGVGLGLLAGDAAAAHQLGDHRVVLGHLAQRLVAPQVRARVADVHHVEPAVVEHRGGEGGAHPGLVRVVAGEAPDRAVGPLDGAADVALVDGPHQPADRVHRHLGGHLAGLRAAHPVGDHEHPGAGEGPVLVVVADPAGVGEVRDLHQGQRAVRGALGGMGYSW